MRNDEARDSNVSGLSRSEDASESLATSLHGMSVTPCSGSMTSHGMTSSDEQAMADHVRRRLAENRSLISNLAGSSPLTSPLVQPAAKAPKLPPFGLS